MQGIGVIGISHHTAPVAVRETFALGGDAARELLRAIHVESVLEEAMVLDTCNRTEVYFVSRGGRDELEYLLAHVARLKGGEPITDTAAFYCHRGELAVEHLFRVAAGLDSQVVGEHQIRGQLKAAYRTALQERTARFFLHKLVHRALRVGRRAQTETRMGRGSAGVPQAAVELASEELGELVGRIVMLVGAGRTGELAAKALVRCGVGRVVVANRSLPRAKRVAEGLLRLQPEDAAELDLAGEEDQAGDERIVCPSLLRRHSGRHDTTGLGSSTTPTPTLPAQPATEAITLDDVPESLGDVDLVICATGSAEPVLRYDDLSGVLAGRDRPLLIVDIAVPRDADPRLGELANVSLCNIDDLDRVVARNVEDRRREIPKVEAIVESELRRFVRWFDSLQVAPTIKLLQRQFELLQRRQIDRYGGRFDAADRRELEPFTRSLCNKILHRPIAFLRSLSQEAGVSEQLAAVDMIRRMFDLDAGEQDDER